MNTQSISTFSPADRSALWTKGLLTTSLFLACIAIISGLFQLDLILRAISSSITESEASANDSRQQLIGILQTIIFLSTLISFLVWFYTVHKNLSSLHYVNQKYKSGWAIGGFFVPFLNLVRPIQVMREVWYGSNPNIYISSDSTTNQLKTPSLVGW